MNFKKFYLLILNCFFISIGNLFSQCTGTTVNVVPPGNNLKALVNNAAPGTCFYFPNGNYSFGEIQTKNNMKFIGQSRQGVQVNGAGFQDGFYGATSNVEIKNMTFRGYDNPYNYYMDRQGPIRGAELDNWGPGRADGWTIDNVECHNNLGSGITVGHNFTITNCILRDNNVTGIGGDDIVGGYFYNNNIYNNGFLGAGGLSVNGAGIKITQAGSPQNPVIIDNNQVNNNRLGIWADIACHGWIIENNYVSGNEGPGIYYEVSDNATIRNNTCIGNSANWSNLPNDWAIGQILVGSSKDILIEGNTLDQARAGIVVRNTRRPWNSQEAASWQGLAVTLVPSNVMVRFNNIIYSVENGVADAQSGLGQMHDNNSNIQFVCNQYGNPNAVKFYWIGGQQYTLAQWQSAGRDLCSVVDNDGDGTLSDTDPDDNNPCIPSNIVLACDTDNDGVPDGNDQCPGTNDALIGTACNDNDPCTINDLYDNACNCTGTFEDSDGDGICDTQDTTPFHLMCQFQHPPVLDGLDNEWTTIDPIQLETAIGTIANNADLSGYFKAGWDNNYLYVFGKVNDNTLINDSQNLVYKDDVFEVFIDGGNEKSSSYDANDHQLMFRVNDQSVHYWSNGSTNPLGVDFVRQNTSSGYSIEIRIAWSFIAVQPLNPYDIGFDIHLIDDDDGGDSDKKLTWVDKTNQAYQNASLFGTQSLSSNCITTAYITPDVCLWMEGVYDHNSNQLTTLLNQRNLIPTAQPYNQPPWNYPGSETMSNMPLQSVDWVKVSFRTNPSKSSEVLTTAALLQEDGCLVFPEPSFFPESLGSSFYIVVEHRNHIAVMSPTAINVNQGALTYDFRDGDSYSNGGQGQKQIAAGVWAMFAGDGDQLQDINGYDINGIDNASWTPQNGGFNVYGNSDYNLDGDVSGMDKILWSANNGVYSSLDR